MKGSISVSRSVHPASVTAQLFLLLFKPTFSPILYFMSPLVAFKKLFLNGYILFFVQEKKLVSLYTILQTRTMRKQNSDNEKAMFKH